MQWAYTGGAEKMKAKLILVNQIHSVSYFNTHG